MSPHHPLEPSQEFGACRNLRHTGNPPLAPLRPDAADAEPKEGEALALCEIDTTRLVTIEFHVECGQFLQKPLVHGRLKPPPSAVAVDQDHQVIGKSSILDVVVASLSGDVLRSLQHLVHLVEIEIAEQG